jgi:hypothetical protein
MNALMAHNRQHRNRRQIRIALQRLPDLVNTMVNIFSRSKNVVWVVRRYGCIVIVIDHHPEFVQAIQVVEDVELEIVMSGMVVENDGAVSFRELFRFSRVKATYWPCKRAC